MNIFYLSLFFVYSHKYKTLWYHFCIRILCCQFVVEVPHAELGHLGTCESLPSCRHSVFTMKTFTCGAQDLAWALVILDFCGACTSSDKPCAGFLMCLFWCDSLHRLGFFISDPWGVVDLAGIECCYNCCPHLYHFGVLFGCLAGKHGYCYHFYFTCGYTVYFSPGGHFGFSIYIS